MRNRTKGGVDDKSYNIKGRKKSKHKKNTDAFRSGILVGMHNVAYLSSQSLL